MAKAKKLPSGKWRALVYDYTDSNGKRKYQSFTAETKKAMKQILTDIQDGTFAKDFLLDMSDAGAQVHFKAMRKKASEHQSEKVGEEIRKLYSWNGEDKLINN